MLSCFAGNDYIKHLRNCTIGAKKKRGKRGLAYTYMKKYVGLLSDTAKKAFLIKISTATT